MHNAASNFAEANPHALATIVEASNTCAIVASEDILDERGVKLWAKNQPISQSLQHKLLERRLKQPLEACLRADDGVSAFTLHEALESFLTSNHALVSAIRPHASAVLTAVKQTPLHPSVQLLLTAARATKPAVFDHAVQGMALAGAMQVARSSSAYDLRLGLLGGLLHDVGEMYIHPDYLDTRQPLDEHGYRHVVTHPRVGEQLLATLTDYPAAVARGVGEHHERLDGTGYPLRRTGDGLSPLGRLLAVTETALGVTASSPEQGLTRASVALRMIPGEFDPLHVSFIAAAARDSGIDFAAAATENLNDLLAELALMDTSLKAARSLAAELASRTDASKGVRAVAARADLLLTRLRFGWNAMGLWTGQDNSDSSTSRFELQVAKRELSYRLQGIRRECLWPHPGLVEDDLNALGPLWDLT